MQNLAYRARAVAAAALFWTTTATLIASCEDLRDRPAPGVDPARADGGGDGGDVRTAGPDVPMTMTGPDAGADGPDNPEPDAGDAATPPACTAGQTRCAELGATVQVCTIEAQWTDREKCASVCVAGACRGLCMPGEKHCGADQTPETCSPGGEWMPAAAACPFVCQGQGTCGGDCKPGSRRCAGAGALIPETCNEAGSWVAGAACANLCSSGSCGGSCRPGSKRCAGRTPETCSPAGTWEPGQACDFVCSGDGACTGDCRPGSKRCTGTGALTPQTCDDGGVWRSSSACDNLCDQGVCRGSCRPGEVRCGSGRQVESCSSAGAWLASRTCDYLCTGAGVCTGDCLPQARRCSGTTEELCSSGGSWQPTGSTACRKRNGESCTRDGDCDSGACAEISGSTGICCTAACTGTCESCRNSATGMPNGQCAPVRNNTDPDGECGAENATTCGRDGMCDGARRCRLHPSGTVCEEAKCASNRRARLSDRRCDGRGACGDPTSTACSNLQLCEGSGANTRCASTCDELSDPLLRRWRLRHGGERAPALLRRQPEQRRDVLRALRAHRGALLRRCRWQQEL